MQNHAKVGKYEHCGVDKTQVHHVFKCCTNSGSVVKECGRKVHITCDCKAKRHTDGVDAASGSPLTKLLSDMGALKWHARSQKQSWVTNKSKQNKSENTQMLQKLSSTVLQGAHFSRQRQLCDNQIVWICLID